jgi:hypothetical protein
MGINSVLDSARENIRTSARGSLGKYHCFMKSAYNYCVKGNEAKL